MLIAILSNFLKVYLPTQMFYARSIKIALKTGLNWRDGQDAKGRQVLGLIDQMAPGLDCRVQSVSSGCF